MITVNYYTARRGLQRGRPGRLLARRSRRRAPRSVLLGQPQPGRVSGGPSITLADLARFFFLFLLPFQGAPMPTADLSSTSRRSSARSPPSRSTTRSTSATWTRWSATATSATRWPAASSFVLSGWDDFDRADIGTFLKKVAVVITSRIGGTSGPLWGTAFLRAGATAGTADRSRVRPGHRDAAGLHRRASWRAGSQTWGTRPCWTRWCPSVDALEERVGAGARRGRGPASGGHRRARAGRGDPVHAGHARPGQLHRRAQHRHPGRRRDRGGRHVRGARRPVGRAQAPSS